MSSKTFKEIQECINALTHWLVRLCKEFKTAKKSYEKIKDRMEVDLFDSRILMRDQVLQLAIE